MISTRVGHTGGDVPTATCRNRGHAEAIEIVFDPDKISYRDLLGIIYSLRCIALIAGQVCHLRYSWADGGRVYKVSIVL